MRGFRSEALLRDCSANHGPAGHATDEPRCNCSISVKRILFSVLLDVRSCYATVSFQGRIAFAPIQVSNPFIKLFMFHAAHWTSVRCVPSGLFCITRRSLPKVTAYVRCRSAETSTCSRSGQMRNRGTRRGLLLLLLDSMVATAPYCTDGSEPTEANPGRRTTPEVARCQAARGRRDDIPCSGQG